MDKNDKEQFRDAIRPIIAGAVKHATSLADLWTLIERTVLDPIGASAVQRKETRRAYYAGASATFEMMMRVSTDDVSEAAGEKMLEALQAELSAFTAELARDEA